VACRPELFIETPPDTRFIFQRLRARPGGNMGLIGPIGPLRPMGAIKTGGRRPSESSTPSSKLSLFLRAAYAFIIFTQLLPLWALCTAVATNAIPANPSSTVGKSQSAGIGLPERSASMARAAST
jgi:hypothetical protein